MRRSKVPPPRLPDALVDRLRRFDVAFEVPDENTTLLREVPTNDRFFTKPVTNVLIRRPRRGLPFLVCVDDDLGYTGGDPALVRVFASGPRQQGWRVLCPAGGGGEDVSQVVDQALAILGSEGEAPRASRGGRGAGQPEGDGVLAAFGDRLSERIAAGGGEPTLARGEEVQEVLSCLLQWKRRLPVVLGPGGAGKTNLLHEVARELARLPSPAALVVLDLGELFAGTLFDSEREELLRRLLDEAAAGEVLALERLELALAEAPHGRMLLERAVERGSRIVGTSGVGSLPGLGAPFHAVPLGELGRAATVRILERLAGSIAAHHGVGIDGSVIARTVERAAGMPGALPGKAVALLDGAAARAALMGDREVGEMVLYLQSAGGRAETS